MAAQQMLYKSLKQHNQMKFPATRASGKKRDRWRDTWSLVGSRWVGWTMKFSTGLPAELPTNASMAKRFETQPRSREVLDANKHKCNHAL